jgi:excisionase family DNA binding protein
MPDIPRLLTAGQVARIFEVDAKTVSRWAKQGRIEAVRTPGGHRRFPAAQFADVLTTIADIEARAAGDP